MSYSSSDINILLKDYFNTPDGQQFLKDNNISVAMYDEAEMLKIAQDLKEEIINTFLSITSHASIVDAKDYFSKVNVGKIQHLKSGDKVNINFSSHSLYRPSLVGRNSKPMGKGIDDIFSLITNGTSSNKRVYGYWTYYDSGTNEYTLEDIWTRGWLPRRAKPFIQNIIKRYEAQYPGITIKYPPEWK